MLISEAFHSYASDVIAMRNQSAKTEENHYVCMRALLVHFGDVPIESLSFIMIRDWKMALDKCRSPETVRNYIVKLRNVLKYCDLLGLPVVSVERIPVPQRTDTVPQFLTKEQVALLIATTRQVKNKCIISFLYACGIRVSELCGLNRGDIHDRCFTVVGKGGKARLCFIDERTEYLLNEYLMTREDNLTPLFLTRAGRRITPGTIQETFKTLRKQVGFECHPHTLRHSFATDLLRNNTNLRYVQAFLGHKSISTTERYTHVVDADLQEIYGDKHTV